MAMIDRDKASLAQIQLNNLSELLNAEIKYITCIDHTGRTYRKIEITYEEESVWVRKGDRA